MIRSSFVTPLRLRRIYGVSLLILSCVFGSLLSAFSLTLQGASISPLTPRSYLPFIMKTGMPTVPSPTSSVSPTLSPTIAPTAASTPTTTSTPTATATTTPTPVQSLSILGFVSVRPHWKTTINGQCIPAGGDTWLDYIDAAHLPASPPAPPPGIFGYIYIYASGAPTSLYTLPIRTDPTSSTLAFTLPLTLGIAPGLYDVEAYIDYKGDDGITRQYDGLTDLTTQQIIRRRSFAVVAPNDGTSSVTWSVFLDLPSTTHMCP